MEDVTRAIAEFAPDRLLADPRSVDTGIYLFILAFFAVVFVIGLVLALFPGRFAGDHRLLLRLYGLYATWAVWLAGAGMLAIALRYVNVPLFSKPLWTLLMLLAVLALGAHALWYRFARYPDLREDYLEDRRRRRHINPPRRRRR